MSGLTMIQARQKTCQVELSHKLAVLLLAHLRNGGPLAVALYCLTQAWVVVLVQDIYDFVIRVALIQHTQHLVREATLRLRTRAFDECHHLLHPSCTRRD